MSSRNSVAPLLQADVTRLEPAWKQAVQDFLLLNCKPGHILTKEWMIKALDLKTPATARQQETFALSFFSGVEQFRRTLLVKHRIAFRTVRSEGLEVLAPSEQTDYAMEELDKAMQKAMRQGGERLLYLRVDELTTEERAHHADELARLAQLAAMTEQNKALPPTLRRLVAEGEEEKD